MLFAVTRITGMISPFMENEASLLKALERVNVITKEDEEPQRIKLAAVDVRFIPLIQNRLTELGIQNLYSTEEVNNGKVNGKIMID